MADLKGIEYLRKKLDQKRPRVLLRYKYYDMKTYIKDFGNMTPEPFRNFNSVLGWCGKAADSLADRLVFREFEDDNFELNEVFKMNNADILFDSAILSAAIASCSFIYIAPDKDGYPRLRVIDGANATGRIDSITGMLTEGYAVLERKNGDKNGKPVEEAYLIPGRVDIYSDGVYVRSFNNKAPYPLLVPIIYRPDAIRLFGRSRISRACMDIMQGALRTLKRLEISAEYYSFPQKYILGMSSDSEEMDKTKASMSSLLRIDKDEDGDKPVVGQFSQQSKSPYTEQLRTLASLFSAETGLTLDDLGFAGDNPSSAEAIKATHENLRLTARKAQRTFGSGFLNAGYLAACVRDDFSYHRQQLYLTKAAWEPVFEPDAAMLGLIGDGVTKINQAVPGYVSEKNLRDLTGIASKA